MNTSLYTGRSGIIVHQQKLDVTSNNYANVNTVAFKASRTSFESVFSQKLKNATPPSDAGTRGSTNPMQMGLGVQLAAIDKNMTIGNALRTDGAFDVMLKNQNDFLMVGNETGLFLTRDGSLTFDINGSLNVKGKDVYGWDAVLNPETLEYDIRKAQVTPITIGTDKYNMDAAATTFEEFSGNFNALDQSDIEIPVIIYDSKGNTYTLPLSFKYNASQSTQDAGVWTYEVQTAVDGKRYIYKDGDLSKKIEIGFSSAAAGAIETGNDSLTVLGSIAFDTSGKIIQPVINDPTNTGNNATGLRPPANMPAGSTQYELFIVPGANSGLDSGVTFGKGGTGSIILDFSKVTQFNGEETSAVSMAKDGNVAGSLDVVSIDEEGIIYGKYTNNYMRKLGQVAVTEVSNPYGLHDAGSNLFTVTGNSGEMDTNGKVGSFEIGVLESSNVDVATETTNLVISQRGLQISSRILTTADELIRTAIDMKR